MKKQIPSIWNDLVAQLYDRFDKLARLYPRINIFEYQLGVWIHKPVESKGTVIDISVGGMLIQVDRAIDAGEPVECTFEVPKNLAWAQFIHGVSWSGIVRSMENGQMGIEVVLTGDIADDWRKLICVATEHVVSRISELQLLTERLTQLSLNDALTGLYNKRGFTQRLEEEIARAKRSKTPLALIMFDIDHFKNFNDKNGHPAGDMLLSQLASLLQGTPDREHEVFPVRESDICARYGGEEFVIILPETSLEGAKIKAERVRKMIESCPFPNRDVQPLGKITISIGVALYPNEATDVAELVEHANQALYHAKSSGRNQVKVFSELQPMADVIEITENGK